MAQITYTNKVALNENPDIADINKVTDDDMNEIKSVVNANYNNTIQITDTEPTDSDNKIWIDTGEVSAAATEITNEYSTSTGLGYSANYINNLIGNESYELTNTPPHSEGTNTYSITKNGNVVTFNCDILWVNSITSNTWLDLGNIPSAIYPTSEKSVCAICSNGSNGNIEGVGRIIIQDTGLVRIKSNFSRSGLTGVSFSISWVLD